MAEQRRPYVAYNRRSGIPWMVSFDRDKIFDYALEHHLHVIDVGWLEED